MEEMGKNTGKKEKEKTDDYSGNYVITSSWPPERRPLEQCMLVQKKKWQVIIVATKSLPAVDRPNAYHWNAARSC